MPLQLIVLTEQASDHKLADQVAKQLESKVKVNVQACASRPQLKNLLAESLQTVVLWSIDGQAREVVENAQVLSQFLPPERVFALSAKQIGSTSPLVGSNVFGHFFLRTQDETLPQIIARLALACSNSRIDEVIAAVTEGAVVKTIEIQNTAQRRAAIEAIQKILEKRELSDRICKKVAKGTDELLLNAFYRAPRNAAGKAYLSEHDKSEEMELKPNEVVSVDFVTHSSFFAVSVRDQFGSLQRKDVQYHFTRDYQNSEYSTRNGLGVFQTFQGGLSLLFLVKGGKETRAWIFVPLVKSFKEFQHSFHFFSFIFER